MTTLPEEHVVAESAPDAEHGCVQVEELQVETHHHRKVLRNI